MPKLGVDMVAELPIARRMPLATDVRLPDFHPFMNIDMPWLARRSAEAHAERTFIIWEPFEGESRRWTYGEMYTDVRRIAAGLEQRGVCSGDAVIMHLENSPESILVWLACAHIGAVAVTTNARSAGEELAYFAMKSGAVGIITQPKFEQMVRGHLPDIGWLAIVEPGDGSLFGSGMAEERSFGPAHPLGVQFTSGTTSRPKGVLWTHANGLWGAMTNARHLQYRPDDVTLINAPLFHTAALAYSALGSLWAGASIVIQPKFSASRFWPAIMRNGCTRAGFGRFQYEALKDYPVPEHNIRFSSGMTGASSSPMAFGLKTFGMHGMTELISHDIFNDPYSVVDENSIGRPAPEYEVRVVHEDGRIVQPGETGDLLVKGIRGVSIFAEYIGDADATAAAFTEDGFFRTGDRVTLREDGAFVFADRSKDMLKVGGENVAASEIEAVIAAVPGVSEAAVVAGPHRMLGEVPVAFVIPLAGAPDDLVTQIEDACLQRLADFKRPRQVRLVEDLPRSLATKVAKAELRQRLKDEVAA